MLTEKCPFKFSFGRLGGQASAKSCPWSAAWLNPKKLSHPRERGYTMENPKGNRD
jgi:hypothetical protein